MPGVAYWWVSGLIACHLALLSALPGASRLGIRVLHVFRPLSLLAAERHRHSELACAFGCALFGLDELVPKYFEASWKSLEVFGSLVEFIVFCALTFFVNY